MVFKKVKCGANGHDCPAPAMLRISTLKCRYQLVYGVFQAFMGTFCLDQCMIEKASIPRGTTLEAIDDKVWVAGIAILLGSYTIAHREGKFMIKNKAQRFRIVLVFGVLIEKCDGLVDYWEGQIALHGSWGIFEFLVICFLRISGFIGSSYG